MKRLSTALTSMPYAQLSAHAIATGTAQREDSPHRCPHLNAIRTTLCTRDRHRNCSKGGFTPLLPSPQCHTHGSLHTRSPQKLLKGRIHPTAALTSMPYARLCTCGGPQELLKGRIHHIAALTSMPYARLSAHAVAHRNCSKGGATPPLHSATNAGQAMKLEYTCWTLSCHASVLCTRRVSCVCVYVCVFVCVYKV